MNPKRLLTAALLATIAGASTVIWNALEWPESARQPDHGTNPNVTKAAFDEIAVGMSRDEVLRILGQPADDDSYPTICILGFYGDEGNALVWISPVAVSVTAGIRFTGIIEGHHCFSFSRAWNNQPNTKSAK